MEQQGTVELRTTPCDRRPRRAGPSPSRHGISLYNGRRNARRWRGGVMLSIRVPLLVICTCNANRHQSLGPCSWTRNPRRRLLKARLLRHVRQSRQLVAGRARLYHNTSGFFLPHAPCRTRIIGKRTSYSRFPVKTSSKETSRGNMMNMSNARRRKAKKVTKKES